MGNNGSLNAKSTLRLYSLVLNQIMPDNEYPNNLTEQIENITYLLHEQHAAELELPLDYYMQEFVLD